MPVCRVRAVSDRGQTLVEYALILGLIILVVGAVTALGLKVPAPYQHMGNVLGE